jgi:hypothetical protein
MPSGVRRGSLSRGFSVLRGRVPQEGAFQTDRCLTMGPASRVDRLNRFVIYREPKSTRLLGRAAAVDPQRTYE